MKKFDSFDPLQAKQVANTEVAANALKREIENILSSYVGWYDPFCELIQNSLDSVEEKQAIASTSFIPTISIVINVKENSLTVSDNGTGLDKRKFEQFLAPCFSFKSGNTRGHKGVGATYLAYGFNSIFISTKTETFSTSGKMENARSWLSDPTPVGNPEIIYQPNGIQDEKFNEFETGVSITLGFDSSTHPKQLSWLKADNASVWKKLLLVKTGLGAFIKNSEVSVNIKVIGEAGKETTEEFNGVEFLWPYQITKKNIKYTDLVAKVDNLYQKKGPDFKIPSSIKNLDCIHETLSKDNLIKSLDFKENEIALINQYEPEVHFSYMYSAKVWSTFNEGLKIRKGQSILLPGIQICANKMPQGEVIQVPLNRNIGRQNQISVIAHFHNCTADMGRKGFQKDVVDLSKLISRKLIEDLVSKYKKYLRVPSGIAPDLKREGKVSDWKNEIALHEKSNPICLENEHFFKPVNTISVTSEPTREQDVISLFNQLIAGGVIRGIKIMSTNERFVYDGMYRVSFDEPDENHVYDQEINPLGVLPEYLEEHSGFTSEPKILEYKFSLDGLIENLEDGSKNSNDISLVVVWETGKDYEGNYSITSLLNEDNLSDRQYHGVTHIMTNENSGQKEMDLIVLKELISFLNDPSDELENQEQKYD
ncbi:hypothetical protein A9259_01060 [Vibrio cyclitrophicus]|uniref:ATP-binding protein n=1 Tax=Vibrio cyclitrophicus TaxID=47951 RepID=UPI0007EEACFE|nr:ATP-binding protein [Vibrio cyclitrophicus]OBT02931.1 hypothetical protein A9259_01060 [Vibrio cyclitrophicus]